MLDEDRTLYEARRALDYAIALSDTHCRYFRRLERLIAYVTIASGLAGVASALATLPVLAAIAGTVVSLLSLYTLTYEPGRLSAAHESDKKRFLRLKARWGKLDAEALDAAAARIQIECAPIINALKLPVFNDVMRASGRMDLVEPLSRWERLVSLMA